MVYTINGVNFTRRKKIVLTGAASGALSDYQLKLAALAYAAAMQSDFDDLRFVKADMQTLIDAWLEDKTDDTSATVWAEFPTTPADGVEQTYYMYYGKVVANYWDGDATFVLYTGVKTTNYVSALAISGAGYAYRNSMRGDQENTHLAPGFGDSAVRFPSNSILFGTYIDNYYIRKVYVASVEKLSVTGVLSWAANTDYIHDIIWDSSGVSFFKDGVQWGGNYTGDVPTANVGIFNYYHVGTGRVNWQFIRKYAANPPTYAFGSEEHQRRTPMMM